MYLVTRTKFGSFLAIVLTLAIVVLGIAYFGSNVYRAKIDNQVKNFSEWTPENVIKDPEGYLNFRETETRSALVRLNASGFSIIQKRAKLDAQRKELADKLDFGKRNLDNLKVLYRGADTYSDKDKRGFPISWEDYTLTKDQAKRQILKLDREISSYGKLLAQYEGAVGKLQTQEDKLVEARTMAQEQLAKIDINRESLRILGITTDLKDSLLQIRSIVDTPIFSTPNTGGLASLDDLLANHTTAEAVSEAEFKAVLAK